MTGGMVLWRAGCGGSRTSGSEGGPGKRAGRKARTAPWSRPYFGAYVCRSVPTPAVSLDAFRAIERGLLHELDLAFFEDRFEGASPTEQRALEAMVYDTGQVRLSRLHRDLPELSGLNLLVGRLVERGLLYRASRGAYDFALPLFRDYLRRRAEVTEVTRSVTTEADGDAGM